MTAVDYAQLSDMASLDVDEEEAQLLSKLCDEAQQYIRSFRWHGEIKRVLFGLGVGGIFGVFLFELTPADPKVDSVLWVVVGDIPPAYLVIDEAPTPDLALEVYIFQMRRWVEAVRAGRSLTDIIPVNAPPTIGNADDLEKRLNFLEKWLRQPDELG